MEASQNYMANLMNATTVEPALTLGLVFFGTQQMNDGNVAEGFNVIDDTGRTWFKAYKIGSSAVAYDAEGNETAMELDFNKKLAKVKKAFFKAPYLQPMTQNSPRPTNPTSSIVTTAPKPVAQSPRVDSAMFFKELSAKVPTKLLRNSFLEGASKKSQKFAPEGNSIFTKDRIVSFECRLEAINTADVQSDWAVPIALMAGKIKVKGSADKTIQKETLRTTKLNIAYDDKSKEMTRFLYTFFEEKLKPIMTNQELISYAIKRQREKDETGEDVFYTCSFGFAELVNHKNIIGVLSEGVKELLLSPTISNISKFARYHGFYMLCSIDQAIQIHFSMCKSTYLIASKTGVLPDQTSYNFGENDVANVIGETHLATTARWIPLEIIEESADFKKAVFSNDTVTLQKLWNYTKAWINSIVPGTKHKNITLGSPPNPTNMGERQIFYTWLNTHLKKMNKELEKHVVKTGSKRANLSTIV